MRDEWELRELKANLAEERAHLSGDTLHVVLSPGNDENAATLYGSGRDWRS
jgi:hypothetical protein